MQRRQILMQMMMGMAASSVGLGTLAGAPAIAQQSASPHMGAQIAPDHPLQEAWRAWKALCLSSDGRVIDDFQGNASHSEGQGYGLTMAAIFGDLQACELIIRWTEQNLARRSDALLAWRWMPDANPPVQDMNNASDGDLFYAWGLVLLSALNPAVDYLPRAKAIGTALLKYCVTQSPVGDGSLVFLPAAKGFLQAGGVVLNPSYYMPRAMRELALACDLPDLIAVADAGQKMIEDLAARGPVPDWVLLTPFGFDLPPEPFSYRSGYEAMRVPLMALWSGLSGSKAVQVYVDMLQGAGGDSGSPTVIDPQTRSIVERSGHYGYAAIGALAACVTSEEIGSLMPVFSSDQPYYPATLHLMALVVQATTYQRCVPI